MSNIYTPRIQKYKTKIIHLSLAHIVNLQTHPKLQKLLEIFGSFRHFRQI